MQIELLSFGTRPIHAAYDIAQHFTIRCECHTFPLCHDVAYVLCWWQTAAAGRVLQLAGKLGLASMFPQNINAKLRDTDACTCCCEDSHEVASSSPQCQGPNTVTGTSDRR